MILVFFLSSSLLYVILNYKMVQKMNQKFRENYQDIIVKDIREFYREMESYSALMENRVATFRKLILRQEANLKAWNEIAELIRKTRKGKQIDEYIQKNLQNENEILSILKKLEKPQETEQGVKAPSPKEAPLVTDSPSTKKEELRIEHSLPLKSAAKVPPIQESLPNKAPIAREEVEDDSENIAEEIVSMYKDEFRREPNKTPAQAIAREVKPAIPKQDTTETELLSDGPGEESVWARIFQAIGARLLNLVSSKKPRAYIVEASEPPNAEIQKKFDTVLKEKLEASAPEKPEKQEEPAEPQFQTLSSQINLLEDPLTRPLALRSLLQSGFTLEQISAMSHIPADSLSEGLR